MRRYTSQIATLTMATVTHLITPTEVHHEGRFPTDQSTDQ